MRLPFEEWLAGQVLPTPTNELFNEAVVCYKASAYRAALLFSYLGFQTTLRDRILRGRRPSNIVVSHWEKIQHDITDDDAWDSAVYDAIQQGPPREVFLLTDDLRNQITYFKNRRNDCAHGKSNKIDYTHVESFWLFIRSNLSRFVVNESREDLINRIKDNFDRSITPPGQEYSHLVREIPTAVENNRLIRFFAETDLVITTMIPRTLGIPSKDEAQFFNSIFDLHEDAVSTRLVEFLRGNEDLLLAVLKAKPERVVYFRDDPALIRKLWYEKLFRMYEYTTDLPLFCAMLHNNLIPDAQRPEAMEHIIRRLSGHVPSQSCLETLQANGFFEKFKELAFETELIDRFGWANANVNFVLYYFEHFEIDRIVAKAISNIFSKQNHPYELQKGLNEYFKEHTNKRDRLKEIIQAEGYPHPIALPEVG